MSKKIDRMDTALRGNGQPGISTQVALLDTRTSAVEEFVHGFKKTQRWIILGVVSMVGSFVWDIFTKGA